MNAITARPEGLRAYSIGQFCAVHGICRTTYYKLRDSGKGPDEIKVGPRRVLISVEAAEAWLRRMALESKVA
jgi:predicted DNA-binding transcriptional regulator AlpA